MHNKTQSMRPYYFMVVLTLIYTSNYADRIIVGVYGQAIKTDLGIGDSQLGLLTGMAFALFYATLGIPMGRLADKYNRKFLLAACVCLWSFTTALSGFAQNFAQLLVLRMLVGVGEAGCIPAGQSLLSDLFEAKKRPMAISFFAMGPPLGILVGGIGGGWLGEHYGWRNGIITMGLTGIFFALLLLFTVREPERGAFDDDKNKSLSTIPFLTCIRTLMADPMFYCVTAGLAMGGVTLYSLSGFAVPFLIRAYELPMFEAATMFGVSYGISGVIGSAFGGVITGWAGERDARFHVGVPAIGYALGGLMLIIGLYQENVWWFCGLFVFGALGLNIAMAPTTAIIVNRVEPRMRAVAVAAVLTFASVLALAIGPTLTGFLSDAFAAMTFNGGMDYADSCLQSGGNFASAVIEESCKTASFQGLQLALAIAVGALFVASVIYVYAIKYIQPDSETSA